MSFVRLKRPNFRQVETAELSDVVVAESLPVGEGYPGALEAAPFLLGIDGHEVPGHPQVGDEIIAVVQRRHDVFGAAGKVCDLPSFQGFCESCCVHGRD